MDYLILSAADRVQVMRERIRTLERGHYSATIELDELRATGVPEGSDLVRQALADLGAIEATLRFHYKRVMPASDPATGDDVDDSMTSTEEVKAG